MLRPPLLNGAGRNDDGLAPLALPTMARALTAQTPFRASAGLAALAIRLTERAEVMMDSPSRVPTMARALTAQNALSGVCGFGLRWLLG